MFNWSMRCEDFTEIRIVYNRQYVKNKRKVVYTPMKKEFLGVITSVHQINQWKKMIVILFPSNLLASH